MAAASGRNARGGWRKEPIRDPSRVYSSLDDAGKRDAGAPGDGEPFSRAGRDAVGSFLRRKKLPTASRRRPFYSDGSGLPLDADPPELRSKATPVSDTFDRLLKICCDIDQGQYLRQESIRRAWPALLGKELAGKLEFEKVDGNVIYAFARNSVELFEIRQFKLRALEAKAKKDPVFKGIRQIRLKCR